MAWIWFLVGVGFLLVLSALFSGSETALFSLSPAARERFREQHPHSAGLVERLLAAPSRLLSTILLANLLVNVTASALFTLAVLAWAAASGRDAGLYLGVGGLLMTGALLVFGEVTPKVAAARRPGSFARVTGPLVAAVARVLAPFAAAMSRLGVLLAPRAAEPEHMSEEELHTMIRVGRERGVIVEREAEILWNLVGLEERTASEVMTPRIDMVCLEQVLPVREAKRLCREAGRSRLPVYEGTVDRIFGVAYAKELLAADGDEPVRTVVRPAVFIPESKRLPALLDELRKKGCHIAVVVDEFGQTAGIVTLEDVLEAIFGEITDEYDVGEVAPWRRLEDGSYEVEGEIDIATLDRLFRGAFDGVEHERLAGFVHEQLGRLPAPGDVVRLPGVEIALLEVSENKLEKAVVRRSRKRQGRSN